MNKIKYILVIIGMIILGFLMIDKQEIEQVSRYKLLEHDQYLDYLYEEHGEIPEFFFNESGNPLEFNIINKDEKNYMLYEYNNKPYILASLDEKSGHETMYSPEEEVYFSFYGDDKSVELIINYEINEQNTEDGIYVEFSDGSCYYPHEFDLETNPEVCDMYLDETVKALGYETIDELLYDEFGELITKDEQF